ncbi:MAG: bifunctional 4-hydroxy-2-oxoglutarate aldolase/2-dehydro-3-deoxy-phosphogluconate aldolase [Aminobacterium colombiense]|jgi:2-dehydro-3-deoxyphosphogluconate aldolase/(4S)-4-hydroxy-2-oxoglutarate aldolase|uniref:bifunctional 4-hydroxy-2-oxoglutarate aldolase/2-dehydro-3-deoxy-phosphogluconate aldolase n=2 Tax=Aminobacterium TaxID=81466 RepID=UPI003D9723AF
MKNKRKKRILMSTVLNTIGRCGLVPVIKLDRSEDALPLGEALIKGGLPVAEVTFRTDAAEESIEQLTSHLPNLLVGAGTILTVDQVKKAVDAGAKFIVSPGFNPTIVDYCIEHKIPITPGVNSPSQVEMGLERGLSVLKFFPAEASGGVSMLKAMAGPYKDVKFIPTGGINAENLNTYLTLPMVHACGGSWMVKSDLVAAGAFNQIVTLVREAVFTMHNFSLIHIGINENSDEEALQCAQIFEKLFNMSVKNGNSSVFAGKSFEIMKSPYLGSKGHIAIKTNSVERAAAYLKTFGVKTLPETEKRKDGKLKVAYLDLEISGFAIHLVE